MDKPQPYCLHSTGICMDQPWRHLPPDTRLLTNNTAPRELSFCMALQSNPADYVCFLLFLGCERQRIAAFPTASPRRRSALSASSEALHIGAVSSWQGLAAFSIHTATFGAALTTKFLLDFHIHSLFPFLVYINYRGLLFVRIHICEFNGTALLKITHTVNSSNLFMSNQSFFSPFTLLFHTIYISLSAGILFIYLLWKVCFCETLMAELHSSRDK